MSSQQSREISYSYRASPIKQDAIQEDSKVGSLLPEIALPQNSNKKRNLKQNQSKSQ